MLPWPLAAIPGANAATRKNGAPNVAGEHPVERGDVELRRRAEERDSGVVDQDVHLPDIARQARHVGGVTEVSGNKVGGAASGADLFDRVGAADGVSAMNNDVAPVVARPRDRSPTSRPSPTPVALQGCVASSLTLPLLWFRVEISVSPTEGSVFSDDS